MIYRNTAIAVVQYVSAAKKAFLALRLIFSRFQHGRRAFSLAIQRRRLDSVFVVDIVFQRKANGNLTECGFVHLSRVRREEECVDARSYGPIARYCVVNSGKNGSARNSKVHAHTASLTVFC
jgi:hypothetical protein